MFSAAYSYAMPRPICEATARATFATETAMSVRRRGERVSVEGEKGVFSAVDMLAPRALRSGVWRAGSGRTGVSAGRCHGAAEQIEGQVLNAFKNSHMRVFDALQAMPETSRFATHQVKALRCASFDGRANGSPASPVSLVCVASRACRLGRRLDRQWVGR